MCCHWRTVRTDTVAYNCPIFPPPYAKNSAISKVFREIGLADELGSGMRNTYKYTKMYSGGTLEFIEGDMFRTIIPLDKVSVGVIGPMREQDREQDTMTLLKFCIVPRSRMEMQKFLGLTGRRNFLQKYIKPLLNQGKLRMTIPDKPTSKKQKYVSTEAL